MTTLKLNPLYADFNFPTLNSKAKIKEIQRYIKEGLRPDLEIVCVEKASGVNAVYIHIQFDGDFIANLGLGEQEVDFLITFLQIAKKNMSKNKATHDVFQKDNQTDEIK